MPKYLNNILICIAVAAAALITGLLWRPHTLDISVIEPVENVDETVKNEKKDIPSPPEPLPEIEVKKEVPPVQSEKKVEIIPQPEAPEVKKPAPERKEKRENSTVVPEPVQVEKKKPEISVVQKKKTAPAAKKKPAIKKAAADRSKKEVRTVRYVSGWLEDFSPDNTVNGVKTVDNWTREGGVLFTPKTKFYIRADKKNPNNNILVIESKRSSAVFACDLSGKVDLNKTPILRWRWRVKKLPPFADGRHRKKDDQAVGVYIGTGTAFNQKSIAYRWETETPVNHWGKTVYSNVMNVRFLCMRNKKDGLDVWYEESRNVRDDFMAQFGFVPEKFALVICGNSQNSKSEAFAEIDHIGFYKEEFVSKNKNKERK